MSTSGHVVNLLIASVLIIGGYQIYFFPQRRSFRRPIEFVFKIDDLIPFRPAWIWVYSILYYPMILSLVLAMDSFAQFNYTVFSYIILLIMHFMTFVLYPVQTPRQWRQYDPRASLSSQMLALVHSYDGRSNCFPSMHVSVSMLTALHLYDVLYPIAGLYATLSFLFPILIALSTLYTKQHYLVDIFPGAFFGYIAYQLLQLFDRL
jgi:membrane-associated phospholipid phosphatase